MKAGFIDLLLSTIGWVVGKTALFALAVMLGIVTGGAGLWLGSMAGDGGFGFRAGDQAIFGYLSVVGAILPQVVLMLWAGISYVRSEKAGAWAWLRVVAMQAALMLICFALAMPEGILPQVIAWGVALGLLALMAKIVRKVGNHQLQRGLNHLEKLKEDNVRRREELKEKFGTVSTGAEELGIL
jgi:hypothetical protein